MFCDAGEVVQKARGSEVLAGEIHGDREHFPAIPFQTGKRGAGPGEHIAVQRAYFPVSLKQGNEVRGRDDSPDGMVLAHQGFGSCQPVVLQADFRLKVDQKITPLQGAVKQAV